jgi:hypothetical protein
MEGMLRTICFAVAVCSTTGCGGALHRDDPPEGSDAPIGEKTTLSAPLPVPDSPYGSWDLVSLDGMSGGNGSTQTFGHLFLELRDDGSAVARRCSRPYFEAGGGVFRCAESNAYDCVYGTVVKESRRWRVDIPDLRAPAKGSRGEITLGENGSLTIQYILPKYSAGHFVRVTDASPTLACAGP